MAPSTFLGQAAMILQNVGDHLPDNAVLQTRRTES